MRAAPLFWERPPGLAAGLLAPVGAAWDMAGRLRRAIAHPYRAPVPVVCVGNLVTGGAGKTPVVLALCDYFAGQGVEAHVVTRGYGGRHTGPVRVDPVCHDADLVGDEALLLPRAASCWVARDRAEGVRMAAAAGAGVILLDDGFQNPSVAKSLALIVVDAAHGFGNGRVMPAGPLRESLGRGLARADAVILLATEGEPVAPMPGIFDRPVVPALLAPVAGQHLAGERVYAFAGIGRPENLSPHCGGSAPISSPSGASPTIIGFALPTSPPCAGRRQAEMRASLPPQRTLSGCRPRRAPGPRWSRSRSAGPIRRRWPIVLPGSSRPAMHAADRERAAHRMEGWVAALVAAALGLLPIDWASALGGAVARDISAHASASPNARGSIYAVLIQSWPMPRSKRSSKACGTISAESSPNTRICAKSASSHRAGASRYMVSSTSTGAVAAGRSMIFFSGHFGNWEVAALAAVQYGIRRDADLSRRRTIHWSIG